MVRTKIGIGTKLALFAAMGVLLAACLVINDLMVNGSIEYLSSESRNTAGVASQILAADIALGDVKLADRQLRTARSAEEVDRLLQRASKAAQSAKENLDSAVRNDGAGGGEIAQAASLFERYAAVVAELGSAQKDFQSSQTAQDQQVVAWERALERVQKNPFLIALGNRRDVERLLNIANSQFKDAQIASWRFRATGDNQRRQQVNDALQGMMGALNEAHDIISEQALSDDVDKLLSQAPQFREAFMAALAAFDHLQRLARDQADAMPGQIDELISRAKQVATQHSNEINANTAAAISRGATFSPIIGTAVILVLIGAAVLTRITVARPISRVGEVLAELANGNKSVTIPYVDRGDEVGDTARAAQTFKDNLLRTQQLEAEQKAAEARVAVTRATEMRTIADGFESVTGNIIDAVSVASTELQGAANSLTTTADTTQRLAGVVTAASEEASTNVGSVALAAQELTSSVSEISRQVRESSRIAAEAVQQAERTDARITELSSAASRIGDVVKLITAIAEQTNLLALNATIEAARAGEVGKGFAVVAAEVKTLANQTAKATSEIGAQIAAMQSATQDSVSAIKEIGTTIGRISEIATVIAAAVEEQDLTTKEIAQKVQQAAHATSEVAANIGNVNRGAAQTGSASTQVLTSAQALSRESRRLKQEVGTFLANVRTA